MASTTASPIVTHKPSALFLGAAAPLVVAAGLLAVFWDPPSRLSVTIAVLTLFVGVVVALFSARYMRSDAKAARFFTTLGSVVACVLLFVLTGNAVLFLAGWLASGVLLARLVGHSDTLAQADAAARRSLATFRLGDAAVIAGVGLLCWSARSLDLGVVSAGVSAMPPALVTLAAALLLCGAAARCALPPFSGWLLSSMTAPTPVSALMHAGLVNAGGFVMLRFAPVFEAAPTVRYAAVALGLFAAVWGIGVMAVRPDIKRSLAGSTVSQMGFMIMSCALGAYAAALWHLVAHGLFKAWLFLSAGSTVGMASDRRPVLGTAVVGSVAAATLVAGTALALSGQAGADLVPLALATATGAATLAAILVARAPARSRVALAAALFSLVGIHLGGFAVARAALPGDGAALLSPLATVALLATLLAGWVWQSHRLARQRPLPGAIYVRLLNAGALRPAQAGVRP